MAKRKNIASSCSDLPFSKRKQVRGAMDVQQFKALIADESSLQRICEEYLEIMQLLYIRIPTKVYEQTVKSKARGLATKYLKGIPDLIVFMRGSDGDLGNSSLHIELKTEKGRLSPAQRQWGKRVILHVVRSFDEFKSLIENWLKEGENQ